MPGPRTADAHDAADKPAHGAAHDAAYDAAYYAQRSPITIEALNEVEYARPHLRGREVLDVASGAGRHAHLLRWYGYLVTTTDLHDTGHPDHLAGDFASLDFGGRMWDSVTAFHFLEHLPDDALAPVLAKMAGLARRRVVLVVPDPGRLDYRDDSTHQHLSLDRIRDAVQACLPGVREVPYDNSAWPPPTSTAAARVFVRRVTRRAAYRNVMWVAEPAAKVAAARPDREA